MSQLYIYKNPTNGLQDTMQTRMCDASADANADGHYLLKMVLYPELINDIFFSHFHQKISLDNQSRSSIRYILHEMSSRQKNITM